MSDLRLYHCTKFESLCEILKSKYFKPSFCLEEASYYSHNVKINHAFAVVCFADMEYDVMLKHKERYHADSYIVMSRVHIALKGYRLYEVHPKSWTVKHIIITHSKGNAYQ